MLPSSTVENYLKTIYLGSLSAGQTEPRLLPMGQLAAAVGVGSLNMACVATHAKFRFLRPAGAIPARRHSRRGSCGLG